MREMRRRALADAVYWGRRAYTFHLFDMGDSYPCLLAELFEQVCNLKAAVWESLGGGTGDA